jgi:transposase
MPAALSVDLRKRVIAAMEAGASCRRAARRFGVAAASAICWYERFRHEGRIAPKPSGGDHNARAIEAHAGLILQTYQARPQIFLRELCTTLAAQGVQTSTSGLSRFFARHGVTRKKGRRTRRSRSGRT